MYGPIQYGHVALGQDGVLTTFNLEAPEPAASEL
jgi:hypothetical protein